MLQFAGDSYSYPLEDGLHLPCRKYLGGVIPATDFDLARPPCLRESYCILSLSSELVQQEKQLMDLWKVHFVSGVHGWNTQRIYSCLGFGTGRRFCATPATHQNKTMGSEEVRKSFRHPGDCSAFVIDGNFPGCRCNEGACRVSRASFSSRTGVRAWASIPNFAFLFYWLLRILRCRVQASSQTFLAMIGFGC